MPEREIQPARPCRRFQPGIRLLAAILFLSVPGAQLAHAQGEIATPAALPSAVAQFTSAVEDREPIDQITFLPTAARTLIFFPALRVLPGPHVSYRRIFLSYHPQPHDPSLLFLLCCCRTH